MWHPPTNLGSKVVTKNTRSQRLYSESITRKKNYLRKVFLKKRKTISINSYQYSELIANRLMCFINSNPILKKSKKLGIYWQLGSEVNTKPALAALNDCGMKIAILSSEKKSFKFRKWMPNKNIKKNKLGYKLEGPIMESPDIIVCPLLCFDKDCNRLGRGGGHYDRLLRSYPKSTKIGLAYSQQLAKEVYSEKHDIQMDAIITEKKIYLNQNDSKESLK